MPPRLLCCTSGAGAIVQYGMLHVDHARLATIVHSVSYQTTFRTFLHGCQRISTLRSHQKNSCCFNVFTTQLYDHCPENEQPANSKDYDRDFFTNHLAHFAGARTNPYAIQVASQICKDFQLSVVGQRRLNKALNDLPYISTADPNLAFGWSLEHVIRSPSVHQSGYEHLLIIVTLAECFHETYGAEVFYHLAKRVLPSTDVAPHIYQWLDLLHFCNGILATDEFGLVVENFIHLDPFSITPGGKYSSDRCLIPPESLADALLAFADVTCGKRTTLTLRGGGVIGWLAGLAEHFFNMTVTIESKHGEHLHGPEQGAQINLIYVERPELIIEDASMQVLSKELTTMSIASYSSKIHFLPYGGRITWTNLLPSVFGQRFHDLDHAHAQLMFTALGSAFRAIEDAKDSSSIGPKTGPQAALAPHPPTASASQLISTLTAYSTSLQHGQGRMERQLRLSPQEAAKVHLDSMHKLANLCRCLICTNTADDPAATATRTNNTLDPKPPDGSEPSTPYCLPSIVSTITMIALLLSRIVLTHPLNASREGVQLLYRLRTDRFSKTTDHNVLSASPNTIAALYDDALTAPTSYILRMAVKFFAGGHLPPLGSDLLPFETVAVAHEGICAFAAELAGGRVLGRDMKGMVRVVNGGFGIGKKSYRIAVWGRDRPGPREGWQWERVSLEHLRDIAVQTGGRLWLK